MKTEKVVMWLMFGLSMVAYAMGEPDRAATFGSAAIIMSCIIRPKEREK